MPFVVIRLRSGSGIPEEHCIQLSNPNTLTVFNYKTQQDFTFDMIATETNSQFSIFNSVVGNFMETIEKGLTSSQYRMDHLVMGYGQSGSGKSYTMFGERKEEGVLPRLIDKLNEEGYQLALRAFEIYNEQLFDLLSKFNKSKTETGKPVEIKQDLQKGVHVQGLEVIEIPRFIQSINLINDVLNYNYSSEEHHDDRKSHKIITLLIKHQKYHCHKEIKLHFVELASCDGQRQYFTRRPSISINKSLSNLNTILSNLMDISNGKPKKHIPFRQSKLTFFLKDMLSASGSNKWIFTHVLVEKNKLPESINSLMFAKRAKCLIEGINPHQSEGLEEEKTARRGIRYEVKMMRKQLENSRFIHGKSIDTEWEYPEQQNPEKQIVRSPLKMMNLSPYKSRGQETDREMINAKNKLDILSQNEIEFRDILKMYEERIIYLESKTNKKEIVKGIYSEKRLLENLNHKYAKLVLNFPIFTEIIADNRQLKEELTLIKHELEIRNTQILSFHIGNSLANSHKRQKTEIDAQIRAKMIRQDQMLSEYEKMIQNLQKEIRKCGEELKVAYEANMNKQKQDHQAQSAEKALRILENENDCLKLTILTQEEQIERLHQQYSFVSLQIKAISEQNRTMSLKNKQLEQIISKGNAQEHNVRNLIEKLMQIKTSAEKDANQIQRLTQTNRELQLKIQESNCSVKNKLIEGRSSFNKELQSNKAQRIQTQNKNLRKQLKQQQDKKLLLQKQLSKLSCRVAELTRQLSLSKQTQISLFQELTNTNQKVKLLETKQRIQTQKYKQYSLEMIKLKKQLQISTERSKQVKQQFNRSETDIIEDYRDMVANKRLSLARKGKSDFDSTYTSKSSKCLDLNKSMNITGMVSAEKLTPIMEPQPRISSGKKLVIKDVKQFKKEKEKEREKQKQRQKQIKQFIFKSKQIKNSIVQKA